MNLCMAVFWLALGALLLAWRSARPDIPGLVVRGTDIPVGWVAIVLSLYNVVAGLYKLVRWRSRRSQASGQARNDSLHRPHRLHGRAPSQTPPDPSFDFTDEPPRPEQRS